MIRFSHLLAFMLVSVLGYGQELDTSLSRAAKTRDSLQMTLGQWDTRFQQQYSYRLDSLQSLAHVNRFTDSLKITGWSDFLRSRIAARFTAPKIAGQLDSLRSLNMPPERITRYSDSLLRKKEVLQGEVEAKQEALQKKVTSRYNSWMKGIKEKFNLDSAGIKPPSFDPALRNPLKSVTLPNSNLPTTGTIPGIDVPSTALPQMPDVPTLHTEDFASLALSEDLTAVGGSLVLPNSDQLAGISTDLPSMPDPMKEVNSQLADVKALTSDPGAAAEKAAGQLSEVSTATKALSDAEKLKEQNEALKLAEQMKNPDALKEQAVDHFAGKEAALQGAMSQMSKYKKKYASLGSLSEIKKNDWLPRNGLKGQPFRERFRIGLHTGFKGKGDTLLLDFYPNASYRITGRLEAGLGAIYRVRLNTKDISFDQQDPVWGMSTFAIVKTFKSVFIRFEVDGNSFPKTSSSDQSNYRDWNWSFHSGIQTNFKLGKQWTGLIQMLYNFDRSLKDGFPERLVMRAGVQYKLKVK